MEAADRDCTKDIILRHDTTVNVTVALQLAEEWSNELKQIVERM